MKLLVEYNGEEKEVPVGSYIKILYDDVEHHGEEAEVHATFNDEGMILDVVVLPEGAIADTGCWDPQDLVELTYGRG